MFAETLGTRTHGNGDFASSRFGSYTAPHGVRFRPIARPDAFTYNLAGGNTYVEIDNQDVSARAGARPGVEWESIGFSSYLTRQSDQVSFSYKKFTTDNFVGSVNSNVKIYDTGSLIFQGVITQIDYEQVSSVLVRVSVTAVDYTNEMDGKLVNENFAGQTCEYIIQTLVAKYAPQFSTANVVAPVTIQNITFALEPLSKCLQDLAGMTGFDWYVDQYKDLHFHDATQTLPAPFDVTDDNLTFENGTLTVKDDLSQLKNSVYIRGGNQVGSSTPSNKLGDGTTVVFPIGYHYSAKPTVTVAAVSKTVGTFGVDPASGYDCLWNPDQDSIIFTAAPAAAAAIVITGTPLTPIRLYLPWRESIAQYGERQLLVIDSTIVSFAGAIQRAQAEMLKYAANVVSLQFTTRTKGLGVGQYLNVDLQQMGKTGTYIVTQIEATPYSTMAFEYKVTCVSTKLFDIVDLLTKMLRQQAKLFAPPSNENFDPAEWSNEEIALDDVATVNGHQTAAPAETATIAESTTLPGGTGLNFGTVFVLGPYIPSGTKRQFNFNLSPLG